MFFNRKKGQKYGAVKTCVNGVVFSSKAEAARYQTLLGYVGKTISDLELQPRFVLQEKFRHRDENIRAIEYVADFKYVKWPGNTPEHTVVEDVKGMILPEFKLKLKIWKKLYGHLYEFRIVKGMKQIKSAP